MDGDWSTPDLVALIRLMLRQPAADAGAAGRCRWVTALRDAGPIAAATTRGGQPRNIREHYDLGNEFFELFLDANLLYSCARLRRAGRFARGGAGQQAAHHLREARSAARRSRARDRHRLGRLRAVRGHPLRLPCHDHDDQRRAACATPPTASPRRRRPAGASTCASRTTATCAAASTRSSASRCSRRSACATTTSSSAPATACWTPDGAMLLQTITVDDWRFRDYLSIAELDRQVHLPRSRAGLGGRDPRLAVARVGRLTLHHAEQIGVHYARTLHAVAATAFTGELEDVRGAGLRRAVHPDVGPVSGLLRGGVPRPSHRRRPAAARQVRPSAPAVRRALARRRTCRLPSRADDGVGEPGARLPERCAERCQALTPGLTRRRRPT